ncbi:transforming acidic coiled-coil-containing protein 3-like [Hetaerina americana]|uniref:transforming acidic coiled-coil-containing protein 3-like n=1 Tax=Hetaerina americana TaxID=62018 RepID=UPI003A7F5B97
MTESIHAKTVKPSLTNICSPVGRVPATRVVLKDISAFTLSTESEKPRRASLKGGSGHNSSRNESSSKSSSKSESTGQSQPARVVKPSEQPPQEDDSDWKERTAVITSLDHETYVQFAREFVEELVTTAHEKSEKDLAVILDTETNSVASASVSEGSFQSYSQPSGNPSAYLPDLLQPEAVYKRHTETDTDTNDYESAGETEPPDVSEFRDLASPSVGAPVEEIPATDETHSPTQSQADSTFALPPEVGQLSVPEKVLSSTFSAAGGDLSESLIDQFQRLDICSFSEVCQESSQREPSELGNLSVDSSTGDSVYLPCNSSYVGSEGISNDSVSDCSPADDHVALSDTVVLAGVNEPKNPSECSHVNESELKFSSVDAVSISLDQSQGTIVKGVDTFVDLDTEEKFDSLVGLHPIEVSPKFINEQEGETLNGQSEEKHIECLQGSSIDKTFFVETDNIQSVEEDLVSDLDLVSAAKSKFGDLETSDSVSLTPTNCIDTDGLNLPYSSRKCDSPFIPEGFASKAAVTVEDKGVYIPGPVSSTSTESGSVIPIEKGSGVPEAGREDTDSVVIVSIDERNADGSLVKHPRDGYDLISIGQPKLEELSLPGAVASLPEVVASTDSEPLDSTVGNGSVAEVPVLKDANPSIVVSTGSLFPVQDLVDKPELIENTSVQGPDCSSVEPHRVVVPLHLGDLDTNSNVKDYSFASHSSHEYSLSDGNATCILAANNSVEEKLSDEGSIPDSVENEVTVQKNILSSSKDESLLLIKLKDLCCSQEKDLQEAGNEGGFFGAASEISPCFDSLGEKVSSVEQSALQEEEEEVPEQSPSRGDFSFLDELSNDILDQFALEAARVSQQILIAGDGKVSEFCDSQSSVSYPLEEEDSNCSSSQEMTDNSNKVEGSSPVNRQLKAPFDVSKSDPSSEVSSVLEIDPFKRRSKLNSSPPPVSEGQQLTEETVDPFKRRPRVKSSPPREKSPAPESVIPKKEGKPAVAADNTRVQRADKIAVEQVASPSPILNPEVNLSEAGPDIAQDETFQSADVFKDPAAFDFLSQVGSSNPSANLRTESLYIKFDPLYSGNPVSVTNKNIPLPSNVMANSAGDASRAMTVANSATSKAKEQDHVELSSTGSTPRKEQEAESDNKSGSVPHPRSPANLGSPDVVKVGALEKSEVELPMGSASNASMDQGSRPASLVSGLLPGGLTMAEVSMARELLARKEAEMEQRVEQERLRAEIAEKEVKEAWKVVAEKTQVENQMSVIMQEYEKTISRLVAEKEQGKQKWEMEQENLKRERDEALTHLNNVEQAFSDVHRKYERSKVALEGFRANEDALKASIAEYQVNLRKQEQRYEVLKSHAEAQLEGANQELESVRRTEQLEITKLRAMLKKTELRLASLEESIEQKEKENQELVAICDELISKLGAVGVNAGK